MSLSELRINVKKYYIDLSEKYTCYDNIKEQFKRYQQIAKQYEKAASNN